MTEGSRSSVRAVRVSWGGVKARGGLLTPTSNPQPDMNGKCGVVTDYHRLTRPQDARYTIKLDSGEAFKLKNINVRPEPGGEFGEKYTLLGERVRLSNGKCGLVINVVIDPFTSAWCYQLELDGGGIHAVPQDEVRPERPGGAAGGARPKVGKGKKGRG